ncbi:tetratricopeptide repeat protein [Oleiharenicola lentus]|uniref:Tetratricopeptide repeat protein n=1 Tax=Oleiharenicola lentus TaxID=2508720 RepID=A0A4V1M615_9BACT|nr:tetratricopeptide repeat protein [Oleiharenicola lentus]
MHGGVRTSSPEPKAWRCLTGPWPWLLVFAAVAAVYHRVPHHRFVNFDDPMFIFENTRVAGGLTWEGFRWAWTNKDAVLWQPLAWLGHMTVATVGGVAPAPHLVANVALHALNAGLLVVVLRRLTGRAGCSLAAGLLFAVHPVNVEVAAWASQLKTTLSTAFFLTGLLAYSQPAGRWPSLVGCGLSMLAKPMLGTFPGLLMLLDRWPLGRAPAPGAWGRWLRGHLPAVLVAAGLLAFTVLPWVAPAANDVAAMQAPDWRRLASVPVNIVASLGLYVWPVDLAVFYEERLGHSPLQVLAAVALLAGISGLGWRWRHTRPELLLGWGWFLLLILPSSGVLRAGQHAVADRYLYVPGIGLLLMGVWTVARTGLMSRVAWLPATATILTAGLLGWQAHRQADYWADSVALWQRVADVASASATTHQNLGNALLTAGRWQEAETELQAAARLEPDNPRAHLNLAIIAHQTGRIAEAVTLAERARVCAPRDARVLSTLGSLLDEVGRTGEGLRLLEEAVRLDPRLPEAQLNLGVLLAKSGQLARAEVCFEQALRLRPGDPSAVANLNLVRRQRQAERTKTD